MSNAYNLQFIRSKHYKPILVNTSFTIAATDSAGFGVTGVKGGAIKAVYGHTSATAGAGNPNPAAGYFMVQFKDNYVKYLGEFAGFQSQNSGSSILIASAGVTINLTYVITILGTTSLAQWQSIGLPVGITPAVGVAFVASKTGTATGTGAVQVPATSGSTIASIELVGDPSLTLSPSGLGSASPYLIFRTMAATNSSTTTLIATAPVDGSVMSLSLWFNDSTASMGSAG